MPDGIITILDENDKSDIEGIISEHTSAENPHGITAGQLGAATLPIITTITLPLSSWNTDTLTQSVTVTGVLEDMTKQFINVSPAGASIITAANSVIYCSEQLEDTLVFTCLELPTEDVVYNISIQDATYIGG